MTERRLVSIVVPVLNEEENASALVERLGVWRSTNPDYDFELVVVDDGSVDGTVQTLQAAIGADDGFCVVTLSRNFGAHYATSAALQFVRGDCAIVLGADLQEPIDLVERFLAEWEHGHDIVWGVREERSAKRGLGLLFSKTFSALFHRYSDLRSYPAEGPSGVLCDRTVIDAVLQMEERNRNVLGLIAWVGFNQTSVRYHQLPRRAGSTKWTRRRMVKLAVDSFVQFSTAPLRLMTVIGLVLAAMGALYAVFLVLRILFGADPAEGWTTIMVAVLVIGGLQLMMLGVVAEYLWRGVDEARRRPLFIVRSVHDQRPAPANPKRVPLGPQPPPSIQVDDRRTSGVTPMRPERQSSS